MKYKTIVIDPPWHINTSSPAFCDGGILKEDLPYETMTDNALFNFNIQQFTDDECDLFIWTTKGKLHTALHILQTWGFHYSNIMIWNKKDGLCNNGFHNTCEFVIHGYKGKSGINYTKPIEVYFEAKRLRHSQKPDLFYSLLRERTREPRIDIFARKRHYGFDAYGNQVEQTIEQPILQFATTEKEK